MSQVLPLLVVVAAVGIVSLWYRRSTGTARRIDATFGAEDLAALGLPVRQVSLLLFTAPGCAPCTVAMRVLDDVSQRHGVPVVVADVTEYAAIATAQHVYRAPTIFVVDRRGHAIARVSGVPRDGQVDEVLATSRTLVA